jgi:DNA-binding NtrC family response regulator
VLIVDDERPVREVARRILEHAGFTAHTAAAALEGIEQFRAHADEIDAVLLDMTMPELSGEEVFRELRRIRPGVRVVLTSGYTEQDALCRFNETGLAGFISKPFDADTLIAKMLQAIRP